MHFGFLVRRDEQGATFSQIGELPAEAADLLSLAGDDGARVVFLGRLYYRDELRARLGVSLAPDATPAELALAAYRHAGAEGLTWLEGDYAFVLHDARNRRLLAARDPFGGLPLFWARDGGAIVFSTAMRPLLDLLPARRVDREYLAEFLLLPGCGVHELHGERCAYEGIHRVAAGARVEVRHDGTVSAARWWDWAERAEAPASVRHEDIVARFAELLAEAVDQRRVGTTAAHLSGGMDSTAIALLAARQARQAGEGPIHSLSLVYDRFPLLSRERPYIESALGEPGLEPTFIPGENHLSFDGFRSAVRPDEPAIPLWHSTVSHAETEAAAALGARTLMTGFGADELVTLPPYHLHELLRTGRWLTAWRESAALARASSCSRWRALGPYALRFLLPAGLRGGLACWWRGGRVGWEQQGEQTIGPWVRPAFARRYDMWGRAVARARRASHRCRPLTVSMAIEMIELNVGDTIRWELGLPRGVLPVHPYRDARLVKYCLGWRGQVRPDPERPKAILADAMRDVLPRAILERRRKGHFNEVFYQGLQRNVPALEALIRTAPVDDLELVDRGTLIQCLRRAALGIGEDGMGVDRLSLTLGVLKWLTLEETPAPRLAVRPMEAPAAACRS